MFISIIIPVFNDRQGLKDTLDSLLSQRPSRQDFEIIVADNGSSDGTWELALEAAARSPELVKAVREAEVQSSYAARNLGIQVSGGDILCFIDADMIAPADYVEKVRARFEETDVDYLACHVELLEDSSTLASLYNCATGFPIQRYLERGRYAPTCCVCARRQVIEELGAFDERLESSGDMEFGQRVYDAGYKQVFAPEIVLSHPPRRRFRSLLNKQRRIGRGHAQLSYYHRDRYSLFRELYLGTTRYFHPVNPLKLRAQCEERGLHLDSKTLAALSFYHIPLTWAGALSYLREASRLRLL